MPLGTISLNIWSQDNSPRPQDYIKEWVSFPAGFYFTVNFITLKEIFQENNILHSTYRRDKFAISAMI